MWVSDYTIDEAFLRIFQDDKVYDEGQSLLRDELCRAWRRTGFRRSDFDAALARLEAQGCVRHETAQGQDAVVLLGPGAHRLRSLESVFDDLRHALGRLLFPRHPADQASSDAERRRRRGDHSAIR